MLNFIFTTTCAIQVKHFSKVYFLALIWSKNSSYFNNPNGCLEKAVSKYRTI